MEEEKDDINFEEVLDNEVDDIWDIFFPYMTPKSESLKKVSTTDKNKPRRYLRFLTM